MKPANALASLLTLGLVCTPLLAQDDRDAIDATVGAVRTGGTTLIAWALERSSGDRAFVDRTATLATFDWSACPSVTLAEARRLLGPEQGAKLTERDGWGHDLEYCLRTGEAGAAGHAVGVRSPGRDGRFDATAYAPAGFDPAQPDHDVVWIDGIFVTWPQRGQ